MRHPEYHQRLEFKVEGQFLGFAQRNGKLKYLRLEVASEEMQIKLPKALRGWAGDSLHVGEAIRVTGIGQFNEQTQAIKLKATDILKSTPVLTPTPSSDLSPCPSKRPVESGAALSKQASSKQARSKQASKPQIRLLVCQKSGCLKKGGKGLCTALEKALRDRNLSHHVQIKRTGCLKRCSAAPNLIMTPDKQHFTHVRPKTVTQIAKAIAKRVDTRCS